ncbi:uncharacterized protein [Typha angustifolia]|uniref:uncharacterized protein n=1 Tax=Typha angustifolia TaxID=59011 RepID=UPI003C2B70B5
MLSNDLFMFWIMQEEFDAYDPDADPFLEVEALKTRTRIIEIVGAKDVIFALTLSGLCVAFSRTTNKRICLMNVRPDELVRSIYYNKINDSLITVSSYTLENNSKLRCRTTPIECIRRNHLESGYLLFENESLRCPGFVEFDDVNGKVLTFSAKTSTYKVFDLKNYDFLYSIRDKDIVEIKISPGVMLLIYKKVGRQIPLTVMSVEDGEKMKSFSLLIENRRLDFIEQFNEKLLIKQDDSNLKILDVRNMKLTDVDKNEFRTPSAFIFLYENNLFLTFRDRTAAVWNFDGKLVTTFEDHKLWHPRCNTNNIYVTTNQDLIISYCRITDGSITEEEAAAIGSINISDIFSGKLITKLSPFDPSLQIAPRKKGDPNHSTVESTVQEALEDITAIFYDEGRNEIYTGNQNGLVHVWGN